MSVSVYEKPESRETVDDESKEILYIIKGTDNDDEALAALKTTAPTTRSGMVRQKCRIEPINIEEGNDDTCIWMGFVPYEPSERQAPTPLQTGESSFSFDTGGGTQHVTQTGATVGSYAAPGRTLEDFKGAIGVGGDGDNITVKGVDIVVPVYNFSETHILPDSLVTLDYRKALFALTGKTNNAAFRGNEAGETLLIGASGAKRGGGDWEITFRFAASPNRTDLTVGSITNIAKKGWEYMWVRYGTKRGSKRYVKQPIQVNIEQVYEEGDFSKLLIGA